MEIGALNDTLELQGEYTTDAELNSDRLFSVLILPKIAIAYRLK